LLTQEKDIESVGVYVFTYRTDIFSGNYHLGDAVDSLKEHLRLERLLASKHLIFVCHSMGGIVVRQLLVARQAEFIEQKTEVGLFLVASPSLGSSYANWLSGLAKILGNSQTQVLRFAQDNIWLNDLDTNFQNLKEAEKLSLTGKELVEDQFIVLPKLRHTQVVEPFSGARYFGEHYKVPHSDHATIAKPENSTAIQHRLLCDFILNMLQRHPQIRQFDTPKDIYIYWTRRLRQAHKSVDDLTWGHYTPHDTSADESAFQDYVDTITEVCARDISYREVMTFPNLERLKRAEQVLNTNSQTHAYRLSYYDIRTPNMPPLMQFSIIDSEEVFIFFYRQPYLSGRDELHLAIRDPMIVRLFQDYFETIWKAAKPLKDGYKIDQKEMNHIRTHVGGRDTWTRPDKGQDPPEITVFDKVEDLYNSAKTMVTNETGAAHFLGTDIRVLQRNSREDNFQEQFLTQVADHLKSNSEIGYRRAVMVTNNSDRDTLARHMAKLKDFLPSGQVLCNVYSSNPVGVDFLIGPKAILLLLGERGAGERTGILIEHERTAAKFTQWYLDTIWHAMDGKGIKSLDDIQKYYAQKPYDYNKLQSVITPHSMQVIHTLEDGQPRHSREIWEKVFGKEHQGREMEEFEYRLMYLAVNGLIERNSQDGHAQQIYQITPLGKAFVDEARRRGHYRDMLNRLNGGELTLHPMPGGTAHPVASLRRTFMADSTYDTPGLQKIAGCDNTQRAADIIFIHGLGGGASTTWTADGQQKLFWPLWVAEDFRDAGVWTLGYAASASKWREESMPLADRGNAVLEQLYSDGLGDRSLIFITHSLGGIVVKQFLRHAESFGVPRWEAIAGQTKGIAFIATPHSGANIANFAEFASVVLRTNEQVGELTAHHSRLRELHGWFLSFSQKHQLRCRTYCETREVRPEIPFLGIRLPKGILVVDETSAEPNIPGERAIPLEEDHISICKPRSRDADLYKSIRRFLQECLPAGSGP
jgi:pimeloyl-ACP methyl ester carboxylesterase